MEDLLNIVNKFKDSRILVVGDLMLDEYWFGNVERISPEAPIPILDVKEISRRPGGAANTAFNARSLGAQVVLAGVVGADENGSLLKDLLAKEGIDVEGIVVDHQRKTTLKARAVAKNQHIVRIDMENREPINSGIETALFQFIEKEMPRIGAVIISDYLKGVITPALSRKIIDLAKNSNVLSLVDGKAADYSKYRGCNVIVPNKKEFGRALNIPEAQLDQEGRFLQAGRMLLAHMMSDSVLVKCGAEGMTLFEKDGTVFKCSAVNQNPVDVSGAGDTAVSTFALAMASGADCKKAVILASHACGVEVGKMGTAVVSPEELWENLKAKNQ